MPVDSKSIQIFLPDGNPRGIRIAEITTRTVQAILIPRNQLDKAKSRPELDQPALYLLLGTSEDQAKPLFLTTFFRLKRGRLEDGRTSRGSHGEGCAKSYPREFGDIFR